MEKFCREGKKGFWKSTFEHVMFLDFVVDKNTMDKKEDLKFWAEQFFSSLL